jgi:hypothetical protein
MVLIPRHHASQLIAWLDGEVSANRPYAMPDAERTEASRFNPYYVSATAQIAIWQGEGDLWRVRQSSRDRWLQVECQDPHWETVIGLRFGE